MVKLVPEPVEGVPPSADHVKVTGALPPEVVALQVTGLPTVAVPQVTETVNNWPATPTVAIPDFLAPLPSVAVALTVNVPLVAYIVVKLDPVPVAGVPPGADHENVEGGVPPVFEALHVTGLPAVAVPHVTVSAMGCGATMTVVVPVLLTLFPSVAVALTTWAFLTANVVVKLGPAPVDGLPPAADHVNV